MAADVSKPFPLWQDPEVRAALDAMDDPFVALDRDGRIVFVNQALAQRRHEGDDVVGRQSREVWPAMAGAEAALTRAFRTGVPVRFEQEDPETGRWMEVSAHANGEHLLVHYRDVTEAKRAERDRVGREDALRTLLDTLPHIAWIAEPDGRISVNHRWRDFTGSEGDTLENYRSRVHPDDLALTHEALARRASGRPYEYDARILRADGIYRWHHIRAAPFRRKPDEALSWIGTTTDVHEERAQARNLRLVLEVNDATRRLRDVEAVLDAALGALREALTLSRCAYAEVDPDGDGFVLLRQQPSDSVAPRGRLASFGAAYADDQRAGRISVARDATQEYPPEAVAALGERDSQAFISVPLIRDGRLAALLSAHSDTPRAWGDDEVEAVRLVADRCWTEVERARAEGRAEERERRLRALVEGNPVGVVVVDIPTGHALEANDAWLKALGRTREELERGEIDIRAMSADDGVAVTEARLAQARQTGSAGFYEKIYLKPDGSRVPVLVGFTPLDPEVQRATAFMLDLTDLRRAEEAVMEGERRYRILAETIPAIAFTLLADGKVEYVNTRGEEFFGPGLAQAALEALGQAIASGESFAIERPLLRADRQYRWHLCRAVPVQGPNGETERWIGTLTDIHEAKSRERVLRFLVDLDDATANATDPAQAMRETAFMLAGAVGADRCAYAEVDGDEFTILDDYARNGPSIAGHWPLIAFGETYAKLMRAGMTYVVNDAETFDLADDARAAYHRNSIAAVVCASIVRGGRLVAMMAVHQNRPREWSPEEIDLVEQVSERSWSNIERVRAHRDLLRSQDGLREANDSLERKVAARTAELQAANEALQGFGYHVSHDLRTPLRAIVSTSRMIQADFADVLPEEANALLKRQAEAARKLGELIDDLLQLSRLSQAELAKSRVDLTALARDAAVEALSAHPETKVRIEVAEGLTVQADPRLLRLALVNLLENAVKYSPEGGTVQVSQRPDGSFAFSDEGIGMEAQYLERIFEPFQRLHRDEAFKGTGIGLANVRRVVTRHGGQVWAESEPGKGSTFVVML